MLNLADAHTIHWWPSSRIVTPAVLMGRLPYLPISNEDVNEPEMVRLLFLVERAAEVVTMASTSLRDVLDQLAEWERHHRTSIPPPMAPLSGLEERLADRITAFAGSMRFVYLHSVWFGLWILVNSGLVAAVAGGLLPPFDPFPFGLLTMVVSLEAIFLTTFVMISQNRQGALADHRAELDYQVNVKAEAETAKLVMMVEALIAHHAELATSEVREPSRPPTPPNT